MKRVGFKVFVCLVIINITIVSVFFVTKGDCAAVEIDSKYGESPVIDGYIDSSHREWDKASKINVNLDDLPIDLWVMQNYENLYVSIQIELEAIARKNTEFIGLLISNSSAETQEDFIDAKIIQFINISDNIYSYFDYKINNSAFLNDTVYNGNGAAELDGIISTYEFSLPIKKYINNEEDAALDFGNGFAFNISYGVTPVYPSGIIKSTIVLINIAALSYPTPLAVEVILFTLSIITFSIGGILLGFYIYKIFRLKENMERYKR
ncbi:MAG: hypothetical protein ACFE9Z_10125 [Promethearchaeota archaeon]